jgi:hypothetical protein
MPAEAINIELEIMHGNLAFLRKAIESGKIKVPDDLIKMNANNDSALHIAARYGRSEVLRWLLVGLQFGLDPKITNDEGETARDIAKRYGNELNGWGLNKSDIGKQFLGFANFFAFTNVRAKRDIMVTLLNVAEIPAGPSRDQALRALAQTEHPSHLVPGTKKRDFSVPYGNADRYDYERKNFSPTEMHPEPKDRAALYNQIRAASAQERAALNAEQVKKDEQKEIFFSKARSGLLTKEDIVQYVTTSQGDIEDTTSLKAGRQNILHLLIRSGNADMVKLVVEGVEVAAGKKVKLAIDDRACQILDEALKEFPKNKQFQEMAQFFQKALTPTAEPSPSPSPQVQSSQIRTLRRVSFDAIDKPPVPPAVMVR